MSEVLHTCMSVDVTELDAYEKRTGFIGLGLFFEQKGLIKIIGDDSDE